MAWVQRLWIVLCEVTCVEAVGVEDVRVDGLQEPGGGEGNLVAAVLLLVVTLHAETPVSLPRSGRPQSGMVTMCDCACAPVRRVPHLEGPGPVHVLHADPVLAPLHVDGLGRPVVVGVGAADLQYTIQN